MSENPLLENNNIFLAGPNPDQIRSMPKNLILEGLSKGEIDPWQLIWSEKEQSWKKIEDVPHLLASENDILETPFQDIEEKKPVPIKMKVAAPSPEIKATPGAKAVPKVSAQKRVVEEKRSFSILHFVAVLSFLVLAAIIGINYYLIEMPFQNALSLNGLSRNISAHANLGGFYQSNVIIIHLLPSDGLTKENLLKTLVILSKSTPVAPGQSQDFSAVCLTSGWNAQLILSGDTWRKLAQSTNLSDDQKVALLLSNLQDSQGQNVLSYDAHEKDLSNKDFFLDDREKNAWKTILSLFVKE